MKKSASARSDDEEKQVEALQSRSCKAFAGAMALESAVWTSVPVVWSVSVP
jgi:hypothetical protein